MNPILNRWLPDFFVGLLFYQGAYGIYVLAQYFAATVVHVPLKRLSWGNFSFDFAAGNWRFDKGWGRAFGASTAISWQDRSRQSWQYGVVAFAGYLTLGVLTTLLFVGSGLDFSDSDRSLLRFGAFEGLLVLFFQISPGGKPGRDLKLLQHCFEFGLKSRAQGAMVRLSAEAANDIRYRNWSSEDVELVSRGIDHPKWSALAARYQLAYLYDTGAAEASLIAARKGLAVVNGGKSPADIKKTITQYCAFLEAEVGGSIERAEYLLRSVGPPAKGSMTSGLLAECAVAALHGQAEILNYKRQQLAAELEKKDDVNSADAAVWEWANRITVKTDRVLAME